MEESAALGTHELLEVHEVISSEMIMLQKIKGQLEFVSDNELRSFMNDCLRRKQQRIESMQKVLSSTITIRQLNGM